jgi:hypothetical protein
MSPIRLRSSFAMLVMLAIGIVAIPPSADARPSSIGRTARVAADPVGDYAWWFETGDGGKITGTLKIARSSTGFTATLTSDRTEGEGAARSVTVDGDHVVVVINGEYGEFTIDMTEKPTKIDAIWKLVANDTQQGPLNIERVKK